MDRHADSRAESFRFSQMLPAHDGSQLDEVTLGRLARRLTRKGEDSSFSSMGLCQSSDGWACTDASSSRRHSAPLRNGGPGQTA